jgi:adenosylcobinamide-phosphate synthase
MQDFLIQLHTQIMDVDRIPVIVMAMLLTGVLGLIMGPLSGNANPALWWGLDSIFGKLGERMDRAHRARADLMFRGFLISTLVIVAAAALGQGFQYLSRLEPLWGATRVGLLAMLMGGGGVWFALLRLYTALEQKKSGERMVEGAYYAIARSSRTNLASSDDFGINRAALGFAAFSFDKGVVAPAVWFLIGGFPAVVIYSALSMMVWRFGKKGFTKGFAAIPLALERLMGMVPSLLAGLYLTLAALFTPTAKMHKGLASWLGYKNRAPYEQGGAPLSVMAWALNVSLGGAYQDLSGSAIQGVWVGPEGASAQIDHKHIRRALYINIVAHILFIASLLGAYTWGHLVGLDYKGLTLPRIFD